MNKVFIDHIGRIMEIYLDDMVIEIMGEGDHCRELWEIFFPNLEIQHAPES